MKEFEKAYALCNKAKCLALSIWRQSGYSKRPEGSREAFMVELQTLVDKYWPGYERLPEEQKEYEKALRQW